jgi:hypothetical protein
MGGEKAAPTKPVGCTIEGGKKPKRKFWFNTQTVNLGRDCAVKDGINQALAIQIHGGARWRPGRFWRWRVIAVKELRN